MITNNTNNSQNSTDSEEQSDTSTVLDSQESNTSSTDHETAPLRRTYAIHPNYFFVENPSSVATMINRTIKPEEKTPTMQRRATI